MKLRITSYEHVVSLRGRKSSKIFNRTDIKTWGIKKCISIHIIETNEREIFRRILKAYNEYYNKKEDGNNKD